MNRHLDSYPWLSSALIVDNGAVAMDASIKPISPTWKIFGRAITVEVPKGDNLAVHAALSIIKPGEVLVIAAGGYPNRAIMGGLMARQALAQGVAGVIIDGALRDTEELHGLGFPMFSMAVHPAGPTKDGGGSVGKEIVCGGASVRNGDWIFADADGVGVFADADFDAIIEKAHDKFRREEARMKAIAAGDISPPWLPAALREASHKVQMPT